MTPNLLYGLMFIPLFGIDVVNGLLHGFGYYGRKIMWLVTFMRDGVWFVAAYAIYGLRPGLLAPIVLWCAFDVWRYYKNDDDDDDDRKRRRLVARVKSRLPRLSPARPARAQQPG